MSFPDVGGSFFRASRANMRSHRRVEAGEGQIEVIAAGRKPATRRATRGAVHSYVAVGSLEQAAVATISRMSGWETGMETLCPSSPSSALM